MGVQNDGSLSRRSPRVLVAFDVVALDENGRYVFLLEKQMKEEADVKAGNGFLSDAVT